MKYISNRSIEAEKSEDGYILTIRGKKYEMSEKLFTELFSPNETEKEQMRRELNYITERFEKLLQQTHSEKFKTEQPVTVLRHLMREQYDFMAEYLHILRKRMFITGEMEREKKEVEAAKITSCRIYKKSNRARTFLHKSNGILPQNHCFVFYGEIDGERRQIAVKWLRYGSETMSEVERYCRQLYIDGFRNLDVEHLMEYREGERETLMKVYGYAVKIK